ncbi:MAG: CPBP family intramembrane metalloprotease [Desulfobacteraceae bacterium]|nr:MAG: CPBP family intramembrane metalloprotease [Desulfobacteraceae bacterium]
MLYPLLSPWIKFPALGILLNGIYFGLILAGMTVAAVLFYKQMARTGVDPNRLRAFVVLSGVMAFPLGVIGSQAANMFYFPPEQWSFVFFSEQFFSGPHQTFHASLILPLAFLLVMAAVFRLNLSHVADTVFLYLPLGHAVGRTGCFLVGCCWGNFVTLTCIGREFSFHNPVPLYEVLLNLFLFFFLRFHYRRIYVTRQLEGQGGRVTALYLVGYGAIRMLLETIRPEQVVGFGMTLAQWGMMVFMLTGLVMQALIFCHRHARKTESMNRSLHPAVVRLAGFLLSLVLVAGAAAFLLNRKLIPWPFHGADTVAGTWGRIPVYLPLTVFSLGSIFWISDTTRPVWNHFRRGRFSPSFLAGLAVSAGYSLYLYLSCSFALKGMGFVFPAMALGLLNAVTEELLFRLVLFQLLFRLIGSMKWSNLVQAVIYGFPHLFIGGPAFFGYAAFYGLVLGWITRTNRSILPAIICHFIADIGAVGLPLLVNPLR